jgi:hypothetical protein
MVAEKSDAESLRGALECAAVGVEGAAEGAAVSNDPVHGIISPPPLPPPSSLLLESEDEETFSCAICARSFLKSRKRAADCEREKVAPLGRPESHSKRFTDLCG